MKYKSLCEECLKDSRNYLPGEVYVITDERETCPRCKEKWMVRTAMATWYMIVLGSAISLLFAVFWSYGFMNGSIFSVGMCNFVWIMILVTCFWFVTSSLGKWMAKKFGFLEGVEATKEWDWNDKQ